MDHRVKPGDDDLNWYDRCIAYSARGYTPSEAPAAEAFTYEHFRDDALAVLDHLGIEAAHLVGLSMGAYSSLQVGLISPERVLSLTLAGVGSGSEPARIEAFRESAQRNARDFETLGSPEVAKTYGQSPNRIAFKVKDPRGFVEFMAALARHDAQGSAHTQRGFQGGRPSLYAFEEQIRRLTRPVLIVVGDEDDACIEPSLFLKQKHSGRRAGDVSEDRPRPQSRAILPRGVLEDGATAPVRRVGSIRAVQGRRTMTSLLDALPKLRPINRGYLGVRRAARRECFPHQRRAKFQKRPYFSVDGAHGQGAKYAAKYANKAV